MVHYFKNITCILNLIMIEQHSIEIFKEFLRKRYGGFQACGQVDIIQNTVGLYTSKDTIKII